MCKKYMEEGEDVYVETPGVIDLGTTKRSLNRTT